MRFRGAWLRSGVWRRSIRGSMTDVGFDWMTDSVRSSGSTTSWLVVAESLDAGLSPSRSGISGHRSYPNNGCRMMVKSASDCAWLRMHAGPGSLRCPMADFSEMGSEGVVSADDEIVAGACTTMVAALTA